MQSFILKFERPRLQSFKRPVLVQSLSSLFLVLRPDFQTLMLRREGDVYFAMTNVDDYKYQSETYSSMSLCEWIQCAHKKRASKKDMETMKITGSGSSGYLVFQENHPMWSTHLVKCHFDRIMTVVPNIVGGPLPYCDQGD